MGCAVMGCAVMAGAVVNVGFGGGADKDFKRTAVPKTPAVVATNRDQSDMMAGLRRQHKISEQCTTHWNSPQVSKGWSHGKDDEHIARNRGRQPRLGSEACRECGHCDDGERNDMLARFGVLQCGHND